MSRAGIGWVTAVLFVFSLSSKLVFFLQEVLVAALYGATTPVDATISALLFPSFIAGMVGNALAFALIPSVIRLRMVANDLQIGNLLRSLLLGIVALFILVIGLCALLGARLVSGLAPGYGVVETTLTTSLLIPAAIVSAFDCVGLVLLGVLQAERRFAVGGVAMVAGAVSATTVLVLFSPSLGAWGPVFALAASSLTQCVVMGVALRRLLLGARSLAPIPSVLREVGSTSLPAMIAAAGTSASTFIDRGLASTLGIGSVAIVNWATKVRNLPIGLLGLSVATAAYPALAHAQASGDERARRTTVRRLVAWTTIVMIPAVLVLAFYGQEVAAVLFGRGKFTPLDEARIGVVVGTSSLAVLGASLVQVFTRVAYSSGQVWVPAAGTVGGFVAYALVGPALASNYGLAGLGAACSLSSIVSCGLMALLTARRVLEQVRGGLKVGSGA